MKLIIDRKKWGRGTNDGRLLFRGKMCCLGFLGLQCGLSENQIRGKHMPYSVFVSVKRNKSVWAKMINTIIDSTVLANDLATINDNPNTSDTQKEFKITQKFKEIGVEVKFKN
jgi:hypothetical protein